jgi:hypothetical protein
VAVNDEAVMSREEVRAERQHLADETRRYRRQSRREPVASLSQEVVDAAVPEAKRQAYQDEVSSRYAMLRAAKMAKGGRRLTSEEMDGLGLEGL